jgi:hypothetical protein
VTKVAKPLGLSKRREEVERPKAILTRGRSPVEVVEGEMA